jgi:DNA-binding response OmpR family regulator
MNILIYEPNESLCMYLKDFLIRTGMVPRIVETPEKIPALVQSRIFPYLIVSCGIQDDQILKTLHRISCQSEFPPIKIFACHSSPSKKQLQDLIGLGISGFIKKPFNTAAFEKIFQNWLRKNFFDDEKRNHIRIYPRGNTPVTAGIRGVDNSGIQEYEIIDISARGMAVFPEYNAHAATQPSFTPGRILHDVTLHLRDRIVLVDAEVVECLRSRICMKFVNTPQDSLQRIYRYIADTINSYYGGNTK